MSAPERESLFSAVPPCENECAEVVRGILVKEGIEAHVTHVPPLISTPYIPLNMSCPHGVTWYTAPTSEQIAAWSQAGVE